MEQNSFRNRPRHIWSVDFNKSANVTEGEKTAFIKVVLEQLYIHTHKKMKCDALTYT